MARIQPCGPRANGCFVSGVVLIGSILAIQPADASKSNQMFVAQ